MSFTAPMNGPGSSFTLTQNRLALANSIETLYRSIATLPVVYNPDTALLAIPLLPAALQVGFDPGIAFVNGIATTTPAMTVALSPQSDNYIDLTVTGDGITQDFAPSALVLQTGGSFPGTYQVLGSTLQALCPLSFTHQQTTVMTYQGSTTNGSGGWGPALLDPFGNGWQVRSSGGAGALFAVTSNVIGNQLASLSPNTANLLGTDHQFILSVSWLNPGYQISIAIDNPGVANATYLDMSSTISPQALFPCFISDGMTVFMTATSWYNSGGVPTVSWVNRPVSTGTTPPDLEPGDTRFFCVTTDTSVPLAIANLYAQYTLSTRIAALRDTIQQLSEAYL